MPYKPKICVVCQKEFVPTNSIQKTCSSKCSKINKKEYMKKYNQKIEVKEKNRIRHRILKNREKRKEYMKEYKQRPEVIERQKKYRKEYYQKNKEKIKEYYKKPEVIKHRKEYMKEYSQRPEIIKKRKEYEQKPEVKIRKKEYRQRLEVIEKRKEYEQKPEVKKRRNELKIIKSIERGKTILEDGVYAYSRDNEIMGFKKPKFWEEYPKKEYFRTEVNGRNVRIKNSDWYDKEIWKEYCSKWRKEENDMCEKGCGRKATRCHHKQSFYWNPEIALARWNILVLCKPCEDKIHKERKESYEEKTREQRLREKARGLK